MKQQRDLFILIKGFYDTLDLFSSEIEAELAKYNQSCFILRRSHMERDLKKLFAMLEDGYHLKAAICFNNLGYNMGNEQGANLWDTLQIPYYNILMDHPFHYDIPLRNQPKLAHVFCIDKNHVTYIQQTYPEIQKVDFLPHAGCLHSVLSYTLSGAYPERDIDVLYAGNLSRVLIETLIPDFDAFTEIDGADFSKTVLEDLIQNPSQTTEEAIQKELRLRLPYVSEEECKRYIHGFRFLDGYAVSYYRELAVRILVDQGIRVHVLGLGWEQCDWADHANLIHIPKVDAPEVLSFMQRAKVVLNTLTWFKDGAHDRIFNGMLSRAAVVTDTSKYLQEEFIDGKNIAFFELERIWELPNLVQKLLKDDSKRAQMAREGYRIAKEKHTWENRLLAMKILSGRQ